MGDTARVDDPPVATLHGPVGRDRNLDVLKPETWPRYRKVALTRAIRVVSGPFTVLTSEGPLECKDGYLAVDARGYPYPIATDEFELIYAPAVDEAGRTETTYNEHGNAMLRRVAELFELGDVVLVGNEDAIRDLELARCHLEDALTRYNSARYRMNGTWGRQDSDRVIAQSVGGLR